MIAIIHSLKCTVPFSLAVPTAVNCCHSLLFVATSCHSLHYSLLFFATCCTTRCYSLSLVVILCHSLYHSLSLVVIRCHSLYHSFSLVVNQFHSLSLDVPLFFLVINDRHSCTELSETDFSCEYR